MKSRVFRGSVQALLVLLAGAVGALSAFSELARRSGQEARPLTPALSESRVAPAALDDARAADDRCQTELARAWSQAALPLPAVDQPALRAQLLGRAKAAPVLFLRTPQAAVEPHAVELRERLERAPGYEAFGRVVGEVRKLPTLARAVFLREGYLYTESPELATLLGSLTLSVLFRDPEITIWRGRERVTARRLNDGDYEYNSGPERGRRARLLLFDRVQVAGVPETDPLHVDLRSLASQLGFDELAIMRLTQRAIVAEASYGSIRIRSLLRADGSQARLECEVLGDAKAAVALHRSDAARARSVQARLLSTVREQVDEALPFDEPKTEDGQQDGHLRPEWRQAYLRGSTSYEFNGDRYFVFDANGRPRPPQVCIDFVLDTFERASGTWWQNRDRPRQRLLGKLRFDETALQNRRSVERFIEYARAHGEQFEVYEPATEERVPLRNRQQFFASLYQARQQYRRGDVVAILGPRDDEKLHYHSFLIVEVDPLSGMPTELAANAGRPRIRSWEGEMSNAPRRSIFARVRPRQWWLESFLSPDGAVSADAPVRTLPDAAGVSTVPEPTAG